jgi:zinc transport system substrate-binding protein
MKQTLFGKLSAGILVVLMAGSMASADDTKKAGAAAHAENSHAGHAHADEKVYKGYFDDAAVQPRDFSDYEGDWQSLYPLLQDGTLDPVWEAKAKKGDKSAADYKAYYDTGYKTDVQRITISGEDVRFYRGESELGGKYQADGLEILTYKKGNRGVRFIYKKVSGDAEAPAYIQFSDHKIAPAKSDHYHIYWGDDRADLLKEVTHWPTYYPADLSKAQIVDEMLAH